VFCPRWRKHTSAAVPDEPARRYGSAEYRFPISPARLAVQTAKRLNLAGLRSPSLPTLALCGYGIRAAIELQF